VILNRWKTNAVAPVCPVSSESTSVAGALGRSKCGGIRQDGDAGSDRRLRWELTRDCRIKVLLIATVLLTDTLIVIGLGLHFPLGDLVRPLAITALLCSVAVFYHHFRPVPKFVLCTAALAQIVAFSSCFSVLMYAVATTAQPLVDGSLVAVDKWLGVDVRHAVVWASVHPILQGLLEIAYNLLLPQTALVVIILGFKEDRRSLESFVLAFMLAALLTTIIFVVLPAAGPFAYHGFEASQSQERYLEHFNALRSGERILVTWRDAEGIITFPSFHTAWAILLTLALRRYRVLFAFSIVLNTAVIISTMTTGWHYLSDVLGGILICLIAVPLVHRLSRWSYPQGTPSPSGDQRQLSM